MSKIKNKIALLGNAAIAEAMRQVNPDVVPAFPITPATGIVQEFSKYIHDGILDTEFITVESEHSAMSACIGAAAAGARVMTATSSAGLALMWELLGVASGLRLPVVMVVANRALSSPINIGCDHGDSMGARDSGWIQLYSENAQEGYDNVIQAIKISENKNVRLPVMVMIDGFITSHSTEVLEILKDDDVKGFIGDYKSEYSLLNIKKPLTYGPYQTSEHYFETKKQEADSIKNSTSIIKEVSEEFESLSGRTQPAIETYMMEDAEIAVMVLSSTAGTTRSVVDNLRSEGIKAGLIKPRLFRPFPAFEIIKITKNLKSLAILDRSESFSASGGPLFTETRSSLYESEYKPKIINYIYGLGGRDAGLEDIKKVFFELLDENNMKTGIKIKYLGVRK
ncbi:pyruvate ferredoxin oxidoreductase [Actinomycetota bacterium]